jgi:hypothetical protein
MEILHTRPKRRVFFTAAPGLAPETAGVLHRAGQPPLTLVLEGGAPAGVGRVRYTAHAGRRPRRPRRGYTRRLAPPRRG